MNPQINSFIGLAFVLVGACATFIMLELKGNPKDRRTNRLMIRTHRVLGFLFAALFLIMLFLMIGKAGSYQEEFSPRAILHIALGTILLPLLLIKILIVRRFKQLSITLFGLGLTVFLTGFALNGITAGYYFLHESDIQYVALSEGDTLVLDENMGQVLTSEKCGKCHTLERVFRSFKSADGWTRSVNRMAIIDAPNIRNFDTKQIIHYLVKQQEAREALQEQIRDVGAEIGRTMVDLNCSTCHNLDQVYKAVKSQDEWLATIEMMGDYMGDPEFINQEEKDTISEFLATQPDE